MYALIDEILGRVRRARRRGDPQRPRPCPPLHAHGLRRRGAAAGRTRARAAGAVPARCRSPYLLERAKKLALRASYELAREDEMYKVARKLPNRKALKYSSFSRDEERSTARLSRTFGRNQHSGVEVLRRHAGEPAGREGGAGGLRDPATGEPVIEWVRDREDVVAGPRIDRYPRGAVQAARRIRRRLRAPRRALRSRREPPENLRRPPADRRVRVVDARRPARSIEEFHYVRGRAAAATMRVLQVNKFFRPGAGAETAFFATRELLTDTGHEVIDFAMAAPENLPSPYARHFAPERSYGDAALAPRKVGTRRPRSTRRRRAARSAGSCEARPDVAHLHNVYHQLTLSIVDELEAQGIPTVMTLHDYKIVCPSYTLYTEGAPCRRCVGRHSDARRSSTGASRARAPASALAAAEAVARSHAAAPTEARRIHLAEPVPRRPRRRRGGPRPVHVVPNFLPVEEVPEPVPAGERRPAVLLRRAPRGREGDRAAALEAFGSTSTRRRAGGRRGWSVARGRRARGRVEPADHLPRARRPREVDRQLRTAAVMAIPSLWEENCPMVVLEARVAGTPLVAPPTGGFPDLIAHGATAGWSTSADPRRHSATRSVARG